MAFLTEAERLRFDSKWLTVGDCRIWQGPLDRDGYGNFYLRRKGRRAHRVAWYSLHGEIPEGMVVNHTCRHRACVNPQHLNLLTAAENALRDSSNVSYINSQKTHCPRGHEYDMRLRKPNGRTQRGCSTCEREKARRLRAKWRAEDQLAV
jgi:hypothetical protein